MSKSKFTPLKTKEVFNHSMLFAGKIRVFEKVILTHIPGTDRLSMSVAEYRRLSKIISIAVLNSNDPLLIGEAQSLIYSYKLPRYTLMEKGIVEINSSKEARDWRYNWDKQFSPEVSLKIREYFKSLPPL